jgi:hypothetical protein
MAFLCVVDGLNARSANGSKRSDLWLKLSPGVELKAILDANGDVLLTHDGIDLGRVPAGLPWVAKDVAAGRPPRCTVATIKQGGIWTRRAVRVDIEIAPTVEAHRGANSAGVRAPAVPPGA